MIESRVTAGIPGLTGEVRQKTEALLQERERSANLLRDEATREGETTASDGAYDTTSSVQQLGRPLHSAEIMRRLLACNKSLHFELANADRSKMGIYIVENNDKRFLCGMESGISPEFSVRHYEDKQIPDPDLKGNWKKVRGFVAETRGWRTVLAMLLRSKVITEPQIYRYFNPTGGRDSAHWQIQTT